MNIGVPKEIKEQEYRVALLPSAAYQLIKRGHQVFVETNAGSGTSGINVARMGQGMGADVTILEVELERMRFLDITLHTAHTLYSNEAHLLEILPSVDLLLGAVLVPGARAPKLIRRDMLRRMRAGSVLVDIAIDQGGCAETSRPTTHDNPVFVEEGVTHYCVANMPGAYARSATQAQTNVTYRFIEVLADSGLRSEERRVGKECRSRWSAYD